MKHRKRGDLSHQTCSYRAPGSSVDPLPLGGCPGGRQRLHIAGRGEMIRGSRLRKAGMPKYFGLEAMRLFQFSCAHLLDTFVSAGARRF